MEASKGTETKKKLRSAAYKAAGTVTAAGMLLTNQRKTQFINQYVQDLYDKAVKEGKVVQ